MSKKPINNYLYNHSTKKIQANYNASNIYKLEGLEGIRKRPEMYIGDTNEKGMHHCLFELIDNSIDEALSGHCSEIKVILYKNGYCSIEDNGRGIPIDIHSKYKISALELVLTSLHAGGKFIKGVYKVAGGLHGIGAKCVNALSKFLSIYIYKENKIFNINFSRGLIIKNLNIIGTTTKKGTKIKFLLDDLIFQANKGYKYIIIANRLRELAFLNPRIRIELIDERSKNILKEVFLFENGIEEYVSFLSKNKELVHPCPISFSSDTIRIKDDYLKDISINIAFQYTESYKDNLYAYTNSIFNIEGGTHLSGFRSSLTRILNQYAKINNLIKEKDMVLTGEDVREGLIAIISIKILEPRFEGQTKTKLSNVEVDGIIQRFLGDNLKEFLERNPSIAKKIIQKNINSAKAREAARNAKETVRKISSIKITLPGKLADCSEKNPQLSELYIVEGESAGGSAKQGRDRRYQAILPIRGKLLNIEKSNIEKMVKNKEICNIITAIGTGIGSIDENEFNKKKLRYNKIILMTDADIDGAHISTLLLTFFYRKMNKLIENGHIYIAQPPLYKIKWKKKEIYFINEKEMNNALLNIGKNNVELINKEKNIIITNEDFLNIIDNLIKIEEMLEKFKTKYQCSLYNYISQFNGYSLPKYVSILKKNKFQKEVIFSYKQKFFTSIKDTLSKIYEITECQYLNSILNKLQNLSITPNDFLKTEKNSFILKIFYPKIEFINIVSILDLLSILRNIAKKNITIQRYKGLGEMNPNQLYNTTMNPNNRVLLQIKIKNIIMSNKIFNILMGQDVIPRRNFIEKDSIFTINTITN